MRYGHFDDAAKEYVIETPATPLPWINYLGNEDFFSLISNTGGGYSFYKDAKLRRIPRYRYNNVPADNGSRCYYLSLMDSDSADAKPVETWSPTFLPCKTPLDSYKCRQGIGYTVFEASKRGIESKLTAFVPLHTNAEINRLDVTNTTDEPAVIDVTGSVEWCLWNAVDDSSNFQRNLSTGEVEIERETDATLLYHKTEFKERRNHYAFYGVNAPVVGFDTSRDEFLGQFNGWDTPQVIAEGKAHDSVAHGWFPIAANRVRLELQPGETASLVFMLGYIEVAKDQKWEDPNDPAKVGIINKKPAHELFRRFATVEQVEAALKELNSYWSELLTTYSVDSGDEKLDRMVNIWHQYQCMVTFNMSRSASYYESGMGRGMGFRDSNQDLLGFVHLIPERARERIIDIASTQMEDGSAWHQYQPLTKKGNADIGGGFNDDPLWLVAGVYAYLAETGDVSILTEPVPFNNVEGSEQPLLEHLRRSVNFTITHKGPHGIPLIGRADWNDCLNLNCFSAHPGESFQTFGPSEGPVAESVFIAGMFVKYGEEYAQLCELMGDANEAARARKEVQAMYDAILKDGWDGDWFVRAYDAYSHKVGSKECREGQIYIEPQGFCVLAGVGVKEGLAEKALNSVKERLDTKYGVMILQPAYTEYHLELGEVSSYPPGYKENAGIFCHNNPWVSIAETVLGRGDRAFEIYRKTCPAYIEDISEIHRTEPYVYSQMVAGKDAKFHGEAKNSWLTGTAAWTFVNISQYILGVYPTHQGLSVDPCIPKGFGDFSITRKFREGTYHIQVKNPQNVEKGVVSMTVDGKAVDGHIIPYEKGKEEYNVVITMG